MICAVLLSCEATEGDGNATTDVPADDSKSESASAQTAPEEVLLEVMVSDFTEVDPPDDRMEVWVRGHGSWYPDMEYGVTKKGLGYFDVGEPHEGDFYFYPDGRDGTEIMIPFEMSDDMISGSTMSQTQITLYDDRIEISGQAIPDSVGELTR